MRALRRWLVAAIVLLLSRGRPKPRLAEERLVPPGPPSPRAELAVLALFGGATLCGAGFVAVYALGRVPYRTQFLGLALGLCLGCISLACIVISKHLVVSEQLEEEYPPAAHLQEQEELEQIVLESGDRFTRKRLVKLGAGAAGTALVAALVAPAASLGPLLDIRPFFQTPWRRGIRLVDELGNVFTADDIEEGSFYTAFPQGADKEELGSPLVVIRLKPAQLHLPPGRGDWAPEGILAYSKICTHAGCAINLYRKPTFALVEPRPAFICPCHYSTFDPARGGKVLFGPAGRDLPQLPLMIGAGGELRARGNFSGAVGPSWWGVRNRATESK
jgi:ubiquinol-cytochrome c reductase iron-sulfur subunit